MMRSPPLLGALVLLFLAAAAVAAERPNILLIISDDQRADTIAGLGNPNIATPNLDRLVREGTTFTRAIAAYPICHVSRRELLTGRCFFRIGEKGVPAGIATLPGSLRDAGYRTILVGKWDTGGRPQEVGFTSTRGLFTGGGAPASAQQGYVDFRGAPATGYRGYTFKDEAGKPEPEKGVGLTRDISRRFADATIEAIGSGEGAPFFVQLAFTTPHDPLLIPPGYEHRYDPEKMPLPANFAPDHPFDHGNRGGRDELLLPIPRPPQMVKENLATYYAAITYMDEQVGRVLEHLTRTGQLEKTIIVFTSDQGLALGSHGLMGKHNLYEHTFAVPLIVRGPGIGVGLRSDVQCCLRDLFPTACEWGGVPVPDGLDAKSLTRALHGSREPVYPFLVGYYTDTQRAIRTEKWKYIVYPQAGREQLFDLEHDQNELHDLSAAPEHAARRTELRAQLSAWLREHGDTVLLADQPGLKKPSALQYDFAQEKATLHLCNGVRQHDGALEFTNSLQYADLNYPPKLLEGAQAATIGGWFFPRRSGEQAFLFRGLPEIAPLGERRFPPAKGWLNLFLGMDHHGFLMGCLNGNGEMPFPLVTLDELTIGQWHQLVLVKDALGGQKFYHNGVLVHTDAESCWAGKMWPFEDSAPGEPLRVAMPLGGLVGEVWIAGHAQSAEEIAADFVAKKQRYKPALPPVVSEMRAMDEHPSAALWKEAPTAQNWPAQRERILAGVRQIFGPMPTDIPPLDARTESEEDCGTYLRRKVSFLVQPGDRMPAWLLVPKHAPARAPAIICFYGTTGGAGKDTTVGLSGPTPGSIPRKNRAFALDMVEAGFVALAPDYLRDGERKPPSGRAYDTTDFYARYPNWSCTGKDAWDTQRAVDFLQTLPFVDPDQIGMVGHSYGGHSTIFAAALEPRIKAVFASGPVSDFLQHGPHWGIPKGGSASQSTPGLRPYVLDHMLPLPVTFYEFTSLIAPRRLAVCQAVGERRPMEEENCAAVSEVYRALGAGDRVKYWWVPGDHDFPPAARAAAVTWFRELGGNR